jgi:hypothetical protein
MSDEKDCVVKLIDEYQVEHSVRVRASSAYEAALKGLKRLQKVGWEGDRDPMFLVVEIYEAPTVHRINVPKMLQWLRQPGRTPRDVVRKDALRKIAG